MIRLFTVIMTLGTFFLQDQASRQEKAFPTRLTFSSVELITGIHFISVIVGVFAISGVMLNIEARAGAISLAGIRNLMPSPADIKRYTGAMFRSTGVGFFPGLLPGCAPSVTTFVA